VHSVVPNRTRNIRSPPVVHLGTPTRAGDHRTAGDARTDGRPRARPLPGEPTNGHAPRRTTPRTGTAVRTGHGRANRPRPRAPTNGAGDRPRPRASTNGPEPVTRSPAVSARDAVAVGRAARPPHA